MPSGPRLGISIVTTCKGRLAFLKQALPSLLDTGFPVTVVDFDCPDHTRAFLAAHHPTIRVAVVDNQPNFNPAMARNIGARDSAGDMILFLDCDVVLSHGLARFLAETELSEQDFFTCGLAIQDLTGACLVARRWFDRIEGYDETFAGWGYEDVDLYRRLEAHGLRQRFFPAGLMVAIPHSDALRLEFMGKGNKWAGQRLNAIYSEIKLDLEGALRRPLDPRERQEVRQAVTEAVGRAKATGQSAQFTISLKTVRVDATPDVAADAAFSLTRAFHFAVTLG